MLNKDEGFEPLGVSLAVTCFNKTDSIFYRLITKHTQRLWLVMVVIMIKSIFKKT